MMLGDESWLKFWPPRFITEALDVDEVRNRNNVAPLCCSKV